MGLIRLVVSVAALGALAYVVTTVPVGGVPLSSHLADIWRSDVVQKKVADVRAGVALEIEERLAAAAQQAPGVVHDQHTDADRKELTTLIETLAK